MRRFVVTLSARAELLEIREYISRKNPHAARRVLSDVRHAMRSLARTPLVGHLREDLANDSLRFWLVHSYLIVYRPETKPVEIVRVLHAARDVHGILDEDA